MSSWRIDGEPSILVVDDETDVRGFVAEALGEFGCRCQTAASVGEARRKLADNTYDLVTLDISMPDETGDVLLRELAPRAPDTIVVMMTAESDIDRAVALLRDGAYDYLCKPFPLAYLRQVVEHALDRRRLEIENREYRKHLEIEVERRTHDYRRATDDLLQTRRGLIQGLCGLAEFRDDETGRHLDRMSEYTRMLAKRMAQNPKYAETMTPSYIEALFESAPLHDIGKVGIPDRILLKPEKLTTEEFTDMKRHTLIGADAVGRVMDKLGEGASQFLTLAREVCESHHERWNGQGYPHGIGAEDIPLSARIVALADFFDATTFPRVYRPYAIPYREVREMIREGRAVHFSPDVVDAFLDCEDEALAVKDAMSE